RRGDRPGGGVGAVGGRRRVALGDHQRGGAVAAADVRDAAAGGELLLDAVERGDPRLHDVRAVAGLEEALTALEDVVRVLAPAEAGAGRERLGDVLAGVGGAERDLE